MSNAPASARLTIVDIRAAGVINTIWAAFVGVTATLFLLHRSGAWQGMAILLAAHLLSGALVLQTLQRKDRVPTGMQTAYYLGSVGSALLAAMALLRVAAPRHAALLTACMCAAATAQIGWLAYLGKRHHWLPSRTALLDVRHRVLLRVSRKEAKHV